MYTSFSNHFTGSPITKKEMIKEHTSRCKKCDRNQKRYKMGRQRPVMLLNIIKRNYLRWR